MTSLIDRTVRDFALRVGQAPELLVAAPGRVNLIGEHTDYNDGFVLPCAINYSTLVAGRRRSDQEIRVWAPDVDDAGDVFMLGHGLERLVEQGWANYPRGTLLALQRLTSKLGGADLVIRGDVPRGAGLSSSASLTVAVAEAMCRLYDVELTQTEIALAAQRAENEFVGVQCGIMDQLASACGQAGAALLIDCRSLEVVTVPVPGDLTVLVVNSGVRRGLVDSKYNDRRGECAAAAAHYGVAALRDLDLAALLQGRGDLADVPFRRARHVVTENRRVQQMANALDLDDLRSIGMLMAASHASMRDDFEITVPKIDELVEILATAIGQYGGARMTGGGFGGCAVALFPLAMLPQVLDSVARYQAPDGRPPETYICAPSAGARVLADARPEYSAR